MRQSSHVEVAGAEACKQGPPGFSPARRASVPPANGQVARAATNAALGDVATTRAQRLAPDVNLLL